MRQIWLSLAALFLSAVAVVANPLPVEQAFDLSVSRDGDDLLFSFAIAEDYYLYRENFSASSANGAALALDVDPGIAKEDPYFGSVEVHYDQVSARLADVEGTVELTFQGCQENGICYRPETVEVDTQTLQVTSMSPVAAMLDGFAAAPSNGPVTTLTSAAGGGMVSELLGQGGVAWVILSFAGFGLLLAFTPCVFPMYPILAATLAKGGGDVSAQRGFMLSTIYVAAMASAFAMMGAFAGWSGQNLQLVLQSPVTALVIALLFVALAIASFGFVELRLPGAWTSWLSTLGSGKPASPQFAAGLGFSSALIVGPCVTAPLAGALLYIAQTQDWMLGAAALFALGLGKGVPLILMGTFGAAVLPRAGAWMQDVRFVFGIAFLSAAVWMATPLLPMGFDLVLWAALAFLLAGWLFARSARAEREGWRIAGLSLALAATTIAMVQSLGWVAGGIDPLRPLAQLASRGGDGAAPAELQFAEVTDIESLGREVEMSNDRPSLVYFIADWCVTCRTIERSVLADMEVEAALAGLKLVKADVTDFNAQTAAMMEALDIVGPPSMVFFSGSSEVEDTRLVGEIDRAGLLASVEQAKAAR